MPRLKIAVIAALLGVATPLASVIINNRAYAAPNFQMPFPCGETWWASTYSGHNAIDWNIMGGANDEGRAVVASLEGTATIGYSIDDKGRGWGHYVLIDHGGGWKPATPTLKSQASTVQLVRVR